MDCPWIVCGLWKQNLGVSTAKIESMESMECLWSPWICMESTRITWGSDKSSTRGLAFDIMGWFYNHYKLQKEGMNPIDSYLQLMPVIAHFGWHMVQYKRKAKEYGTVGVCTASAFERQVEMTLFGFEGLEETYKEPVDGEDDQLRLPFRFWGYNVVELEPQHHYKAIDNYFKVGRNRADNNFFFASKGLVFF